jgi:tetratricopeptide (TPR) repeat protein
MGTFLAAAGQLPHGDCGRQISAGTGTPHPQPEDEAWIQILWGRALFAQGDYQTAHSRFTRVITMEQSPKDSLQRTIGLLYLGETHQAGGNLAAARQCYQEVLRDFEASALASSRSYHQMEAIARALNDLGDLYNLEGNYLTAGDYYEQASAAFHDIGDREREAWVLSNLSLMDIRVGDYVAAQQRIEETLQLEIKVGNRQGEAIALNTLARVLYHTGKSKEARSLLRQALTISRQIGIRSEEADILTTLGHVFTALGRLENATEAYEQGLRLRRELGQSNRALENLTGMAETARRRGRHDRGLFTGRGKSEMDRTARNRGHRSAAHDLT